MDTVSPQATVQEEPLGVSRDFLRTVCEPFFDQMLSALQQALQQKLCEDQFASMQAASQCRHQDADSDDDESTYVEDFGAFASVLSSPEHSACTSSEDDVAHPSKAEHQDAVSEIPELVDPIISTTEVPDPISGGEKSTMVCRHWKTKGWCRLGAKCKFQHPEHKRGVSAPKGNHSATVSSKVGGINKAEERPAIRTTLSLTDALSGDCPAPPVAAFGHPRSGSNERLTQSKREKLACTFPPAEHVVVGTQCTSAVQIS